MAIKVLKQSMQVFNYHEFVFTISNPNLKIKENCILLLNVKKTVGENLLVDVDLPRVYCLNTLFFHSNNDESPMIHKHKHFYHWSWMLALFYMWWCLACLLGKRFQIERVIVSLLVAFIKIRVYFIVIAVPIDSDSVSRIFTHIVKRLN